MKVYRVAFSPLARDEAIEAADYIAERSTDNADAWLAGLHESIHSLRQMPGRCGLAREHEAFGEPLRQYIYQSHRIIFRIEESARIVRVLHVRHAARRSVDPSE